VGDWNDGTGTYRVQLIGVFSSNSVLLAQSQLNRVSGAIAAGTPLITRPTQSGSLPTDIPQDFLIQPPENPPGIRTNISIRVPLGAAFLFVSANDSKFSDNSDDSTNHFGVLIEGGTETFVSGSIISSNSISISWNTDSNQLYQAQTSMFLSSGWTNFGTPMLGVGSAIAITNSTVGQLANFYRIMRVP
jgi:hypothetical protein